MNYPNIQRNHQSLGGFLTNTGVKSLFGLKHHVNHVRNKPELALSRYFYDERNNRRENLIPLCNRCHNLEHPEKLRKNKSEGKFINVERW